MRRVLVLISMLLTAGIVEWAPGAQAQAAPPDPLFTDGDYDGVVDAQDNCPNLWNADQQDTDGDGRGDRCDVDVVSGPVVHPFNGNTYLVLSPASWEVSEAAAVRFGGHLVTVNDAAEQAWLVDTFGALADRMWIGLRDVGGPYPKLTLAMRWEWVDGSTSDYRGFRPGEPDAVFYYYDDWELGQWAWSNSQEYAVMAQNTIIPGWWWYNANDLGIGDNFAGIPSGLVEIHSVRTEWALGLNDGRSDEFSTENRRVDAAPGAVTRIQGDDFHYDGAVPRDDDFYTAGVYPQGFNGLPRRLDVPFDEPSSAWERALTKADPVNRIHLTLGRAQVADGSRFRIVWKYRAAGAVPTGAFERSTSVRLRGAFGEKDLGTVRRTGGLTEESLEFSFEGTSFEGGPVTLELRGNFPPDRTEAWTVFDFVRLELAPVPVFPPMGPVFATGGKHLTFTLQAELPGAENLGLVHELLKGPEGLTVTPTGVVDWTPPSARDWPVFPGDAAVHWIQIGVRDPRNPQRLYPGPMTRIDVWEAILQAGTASDCELGEILVPIVGEGFKNMVALEGSLKWDPAVLTYRGTVTGDLAGTGELTGPPEAPDGIARFLWWTTATGDGVPDGQPLFHIRFAVTGPPGSSTSIQFQTCRAYRDSGEPVAIVGREGAVSGFYPVIGSGHVRYFGSALPVAGAEIHQGYGFSYSNAKLAFCRLETHRTTRTDTSGGFKVDLDSGTYDSHDPRKLWAGADVAEDTRTSGITMLDWLRLREHLLGLRPLTSAFSVVAADTHFDFIYDFYAGIVHGAYGAELPLDVLDLRRIARFVNGSLPPDDNPGWWPVGSWRMFPSSWGPDSIQHCYSDIGGSDPLNPYGYTVPVQNLWETEAGPQEWPGLDFVAVKVGDVNGSWGMEASAMATRSSGPALQVLAESVTATPGDVIRVALRTSAAERLTTAQFSIHWDPAVLEYVELGDLSLRGLGPDSLGLGRTLPWRRAGS